MAAVAKSVALSFGLMSADVSVHNALDTAASSGNKIVCTGFGEHDPHDPLPISQLVHCRACDDTVPYTDLKRARPVGDGFVLITAEEVAEAKTDVDKLKRATSVTAHPTEQVDLSTGPGAKLYYLVPNPGAQQAYATFVHLIESHPELTFMALWTPRSRASQFALKVKNGCLVWQERERGENIRPVPEIDASAPEPMLAMAEQVLGLDGVVSDYDPATYEDTYERKLADIIATKTPVAGQMQIDTPGVTVPSTAVAGMEALKQMLADAEKSKRPAKKAAAKRVRKSA